MIRYRLRSSEFACAVFAGLALWLFASPEVRSSDSDDLRRSVGQRYVSWRIEAGADAELLVRGDGGPRTLDDLANDIRALGRWTSLKPDARLPARDVILVYESRLVDRYGAVSTAPVVIVRFARSEWVKVQWETIPAASLLHLGRMVMLHPAAGPGAKAWCLAHSSPERGFCREIASRY